MKFIFIGDSLRQENDSSTYPQEGWPRERKGFYPEIDRVNLAKNGRSTKSFLDEGRFQEALHLAKEGDLCFISFGHNDEKQEDPSRYTDPYGSYEDNLIYRINERKKKGVSPILLTSITRLKYDEDSVLLRTHKEYPKARKEVALLEKIPLIDLEERTYQFLRKSTFEENKKYYRILEKNQYPNYPEGKDDHTHLTKTGATWIASRVADKLKKYNIG